MLSRHRTKGNNYKVVIGTRHDYILVIGAKIVMCPRHRTECRQRSVWRSKWKRGRSTKSSHLNTGHSGNDVASIFFSKLLEKSMPTIVYVYLHTSGRQSREAKRSLIASQRQDHCVLNCLKHLSRLENIGIRSFIHTCYTYVYITIRIHNHTCYT